MKKIRWTSAFKADFKRLSRNPRFRDAVSIFEVVATKLAAEEQLEPGLRDHPLTGEWKGCRECHLSPDLLLIYRKEGESTIALARLGTHSELFR